MNDDSEDDVPSVGWIREAGQRPRPSHLAEPALDDVRGPRFFPVTIRHNVEVPNSPDRVPHRPPLSGALCPMPFIGEDAAPRP